MKPRHIAFAMIVSAYLALGISLVGCATVRPASNAAMLAAQTAGNATARAATAAASAREAIAKAKQEIARQDGPAAQTALDEASTKLGETQEQLAVARTAEATATQQIDEISKALQSAAAEADRLKAARDFWRAATWKLALLALALGLWTFRKPLLALCGAPIL